MLEMTMKDLEHPQTEILLVHSRRLCVSHCHHLKKYVFFARYVLFFFLFFPWNLSESAIHILVHTILRPNFLGHFLHRLRFGFLAGQGTSATLRYSYLLYFSLLIR